MKNNIKIIRENLAYTQIEFAKMLKIPVKSIRNWEQNIRVPSPYIVELIIDVALRMKTDQRLINTENYIPSFFTIKTKVEAIASKYNIDKVYLYGPFVKGIANYQSAIDLYIISNLGGFGYFRLLEDLRLSLNKKINLLSSQNIEKDSLIHKEIKLSGIIIYQK